MFFDTLIRIHIHFSPVVSRNSLYMVNAQVCLFKKRQCLSLITTNLTGGRLYELIKVCLVPKRCSSFPNTVHTPHKQDPTGCTIIHLILVSEF